MRSEEEIRTKLSELETKLEDHIKNAPIGRLPESSRYYTIKYQLTDEIRTLKWVLFIPPY